MRRKPTIGDLSGPLSRKRTADMLRRLRALTHQIKTLKMRVDAAERANGGTQRSSQRRVK